MSKSQSARPSTPRQQLQSSKIDGKNEKQIMSRKSNHTKERSASPEQSAQEDQNQNLLSSPPPVEKTLNKRMRSPSMSRRSPGSDSDSDVPATEINDSLINETGTQQCTGSASTQEGEGPQPQSQSQEIIDAREQAKERRKKGLPPLTPCPKVGCGLFHWKKHQNECKAPRKKKAKTALTATAPADVGKKFQTIRSAQKIKGKLIEDSDRFFVYVRIPTGRRATDGNKPVTSREVVEGLAEKNLEGVKAITPYDKKGWLIETYSKEAARAALALGSINLTTGHKASISAYHQTGPQVFFTRFSGIDTDRYDMLEQIAQVGKEKSGKEEYWAGFELIRGVRGGGTLVIFARPLSVTRFEVKLPSKTGKMYNIQLAMVDNSKECVVCLESSHTSIDCPCIEQFYNRDNKSYLLKEKPDVEG